MQFGLIATAGFVLLALGVAQKFFHLAVKDWPALALILAFFAQGIFYYPTHLTVVLLVFTLSYLFTTKQQKEHDTPLRFTNTAEKTLLLLLTGGLLLWIIPILKAEFIVSTYTQTALPAPSSEMEQNAKLLINNNVLKRYLVYHYPENALSQKILPALATSSDIDDLRIAADSYYIIARKNNSIDAAQASITVFEKLLAINNTFPSSLDGIGLRHLFVGNFAKAKESFIQAITLKPDYWYAYMHLGEVSRQQCNPKEALEWYTKAEQYIPTAEKEKAEAKQEMTNPRAECK